ELRFVQGAGAVDGDPVGLDQAYGEGAEFGDEAIGDGLVLVCAFAHSVELDYVAVGLVDGQAGGGAGFAARGDGGVDPRQGFFARRVDHVDQVRISADVYGAVGAVHRERFPIHGRRWD